MCETAHVPAGRSPATTTGGRSCHGRTGFFLVGILAALAGILAEADIAIFALSTYNTDYILVSSIT